MTEHPFRGCISRAQAGPHGVQTVDFRARFKLHTNASSERRTGSLFKQASLNCNLLFVISSKEENKIIFVHIESFVLGYKWRVDKKDGTTSFRQQDQLSLPSWYRWQRHLFLHALFFTGSLTGGLLMAHVAHLEWNPQSILLLAALIFVWANLEYLIHRFILHGSIPLLQGLAREHSYNHHHYFTDTFMFAQQGLDLNRILLMPWHLFGVLALNGLLAVGLSLFTEKLALLFYFAGLFYSLLYETMHGLSHWGFGSKFPLLQSTLFHHRQHHDIKKMNFTNFAVVFPIIDSIWGTQSAKANGQ